MNSTNEEVKSEREDFKRCGGRRRWKIPFIIATVILLKSVIVFGLWNCLVPDLFHGPVITYWQALGLLVLAKLIFGLGGPRHFGGGGHHRHGWRRDWLAHLTPEEREKFKNKMCGFGDRHKEHKQDK